MIPSDIISKALNSPGSVRYVAEKSGIPRTTLRSIFDGSVPSVDRAAAICDALGLEFYIGPPRGDAAIDTVVEKHKPEPGGHDDVAGLREQVADLAAKFEVLSEKLEPESHPPQPPAATPDLGGSIDHDLLALIIERVDVRLKKLNRELPANKKAALYLKTYDHIIELEQRDQEIDWDNVIKKLIGTT